MAILHKMCFQFRLLRRNELLEGGRRLKPGSILHPPSKLPLVRHDGVIPVAAALTRRPCLCAGSSGSPGLWVVPDWAQGPDPDAVNVILKPGVAFGAGDHPTTALCLRWLHRNQQALQARLRALGLS